MKDANVRNGEIDSQELERQLSCPSGQTGIEVAKEMNETNMGMTLNTIDVLDLQDHQSVLELGHGNCGHLNKLMAKASGIQYSGLELSDTMFHEARRVNQNLVGDNERMFQRYNGIDIPFEDDTFDRIMTVNTLYFWSSPAAFLNEIGRVLKPGGYCVIAYVQKEFMKKLPFVSDIFRLYDDNDLQELVGKSNLKLVQIVPGTEQVRIRSGELVERTYSMAKLGKVFLSNT